MQRNLDLSGPGQVGETRVEPTNTGHAIEIDVQNKTIRLEFRDDEMFEFVDRLVTQANEHKSDD